SPGASRPPVPRRAPRVDPLRRPRRGRTPMAWSWTPERRDEPELMDAPGLPEAEVAEAYRVLRRVNRQLGNLRGMRLELRRFLDEGRAGSGRITLLDVGSGSGDVPRASLEYLAARGIAALGVALDRDSTALRMARRHPVA